jgi:small subunit ribosomal protein S9
METPVTEETVVQESVTETETPTETPVESPVETPETPETQPEVVAPVARQPDGVIWGTGRRKSSVARVRVKAGTGRILVNGREYKEFFPSLQYQVMVEAPLKATGAGNRVDILANLSGGGLTGQAGALSLGIARALIKIDPSTEEALREKSLLTRDARMKERKKYGLHGARRGVQFSKR